MSIISKDIKNNISWQLIGRFINMLLGLLSSAVIARYLGSDLFGSYSFARAISSMILSFSLFGMENALISMFSGKNNTNCIIGTSLVLRFFVCCVCIICLGFYALIRNNNEDIINIFILTMPIFIQILDIYEFYLKSKLDSRWYIIYQSVVQLLFFLLRVWGVINNDTLSYFVIIQALQIVFVSCGAFLIVHIVYKENIRPVFNIKLFKMLFKICAPLAVSSIAISLYTKFDQVMVKTILGYSANGIYSVAESMVEYWYVVTGVVSASFIPELSRLYRKNYHDYLKYLQEVIDILVCLSYGAVIMYIVFGGAFIKILYGKQYLSAVPIMYLYVVSIIFATVGYARGISCAISGRTYFTLVCTILGTVCNVVFNLYFLKTIGLIGAAISTIFAQMITGWIATFLDKSFIDIALIQTKALFPWGRVRKYLKEYLKNKKV